MRTAFTVAVVLAATGVSPALARDAERSRTGRLLVSLEDAGSQRVTAARASAVTARTGARPTGFSVPEVGLVTVTPAPGQTLAQAAAHLRSDPAVRAVSAERRYTLRLVPDDPALVLGDPTPGVPAGTVRQWWAARSGFFTAWERTDGVRARVGVIDTGADGDHPELATRIVYAVDRDPTDPAGRAGEDVIGHGTHVSSLACADSANGIGIAGAGFDCGLMVMKSDLTDSSIVASIIDAADRGAHAINMSFGDDGSVPAGQALRDAIDYALERDVVLVAAAADEPITEQGLPANLLQPTGTGATLAAGKGLVVTAADASDGRASFAGLGSQISIAAYGSYGSSGPPGLLAAFPDNITDFDTGSLLPPALPCFCRVDFGGDDRYAELEGTSMAAPQVAAVAAVVRAFNPGLSARATIRVLKQTARRPGGGGWSEDLGWGILDAGAALDLAARLDRTAPTSRVVSARRRGRRVTLRISGRDRAPAGVELAGLRTFEIWVKRGSARARRVARTTSSRRSIRLRGTGRHAIWTRAVDRAGNRERSPRKGDVRVRVR